MDDKPDIKSQQSDLKARLGLVTRKSKATIAKEEEEKRRAEEQARQQAEAEKQERQRLDNFTLAGRQEKAPAPDWAPTLDLGEEELAALETLPDAGKQKRRMVIAILAGITLLFSLGVGYYFGKAFANRRIQNSIIAEAKLMIEYVEADGKGAFKALGEHKQAIDDVIAKLNKPDVDPSFELEQLNGFIDTCEKYLERNKALTAKDILPNQIFNAEVIPDVVTFVQRVDKLRQLTSRMVEERKLLQLTDLGDEEPEPAAAEGKEGEAKPGEPAPKMQMYLVLEAFKVQDVIPWNRGRFVTMAGEVKRAESVSETGDSGFAVPVKFDPKKQPEDVDTARVAEVDVWPVVLPQMKRQAELYKRALIARTKGTLAEMKIAADAVRWDLLQKKLQAFADKEPYFTF